MNQAAAPATCTFWISPTRATFGRASGNGGQRRAAGTGSGTVFYSVAPLTGQGNGNGRLTIAGQTFNVKQSK